MFKVMFWALLTDYIFLCCRSLKQNPKCPGSCQTWWFTARACTSTALSTPIHTPNATRSPHSLNPKPRSSLRKQVDEGVVYSSDNKWAVKRLWRVIQVYYNIWNCIWLKGGEVGRVIYAVEIYCICSLQTFSQGRTLCSTTHGSWAGLTPAASGQTHPITTPRTCGAWAVR